METFNILGLLWVTKEELSFVKKQMKAIYKLYLRKHKFSINPEGSKVAPFAQK